MIGKTTVERILKNTQLPIDIFFSLAVEEYYGKIKDVMGRAGDFLTAPAASQIFCHAIGVWIYNKIMNLKRVILVELGPGHGTLMDEVIQFIKQDKECISKVEKIYLVEKSSIMIAKQKETLIKHQSMVFHWVSNLSEIKESDVSFVIIANEFFDALPVKQFIKLGDKFHEIFVCTGPKLNHSPEAIEKPEMEKIMKYSNNKPDDFLEGEVYEMSSFSHLQLILDLVRSSAGSSALMIDYGYLDSLKRSTIKAISKHQILENFLEKPGAVDLSVHVDFGTMINFTKHYNHAIKTSFWNQKDFLKQNQLEALVKKAKSCAKDDNEIALVDSEIHRISVEMGEIFKVLEFTKD